MFQGDSVRVVRLDEGFVEIRFDRRGEAINKLDVRTLGEFRQAVERVTADAGVRGVLLTSAKDVFIVGADITEFGEMFAKPAEAITAQALANHRTLCALEDLPVPSVAALNGYALGGGLEIALGAALRVVAAGAQVGVPEVKLGLFPGLGGTVRLARLAGAATAVDWVAGGQPADAQAALAAGVVDEIAAPAALHGAALALLRRCAAGEVDWRARQQRKREAVAMPRDALRDRFEAALARVRAQSPAHQPAAAMAVEVMARGAGCPREEALALEAEAFGRVCKTQAAAALVQAFLDAQALKKLQRRQAADGHSFHSA